MTTNKKVWIFGAMALVLALAITSIIIRQPEREPPKNVIKVGCITTAAHNFVLFVAQEKGFFNDYGLEVQLKEMEAPMLLPAFLANEIDYFSATVTAVKASLKGTSVKTVTTLVNSTPYGLISQPDLELNDLKTLGIVHRFITAHYVALKIIEESNLSVELISPEGTLSAIPLLVSGKVDALLYTLPGALQLEKEGYPILLKYWIGSPQTFSTSEEKIKNNPEEVEKMINALRASAEFIRNNPQESKELLYDFFKLEKTEANQKIIEELYLISKKEVEVGAPTKEAMEILIKLARAGQFHTCEDVDEQTVTDEDINAAFDLRFVK